MSPNSIENQAQKDSQSPQQRYQQLGVSPSSVDVDVCTHA